MLLLPLARGGVDAPVELAAACLALLAALMAAPAGGAVGLAGLALLVVLAATALQLAPLPAWLHLLSPSARDLFSGALAPLGLYPAARPLSLDPAATGRLLAASAGGLAAFWAAWALGETHRRRDLLVRALGLGGLLVALVALGQALLGFGTLLSPAAPFVNPNHLAGHLGLTSFVLLGLALKARGQARLLWLMAFALAGAVVFLSLSRGGIAAFLGGAVLFVALAAWRRRPEGSGAGPPRGRWALLGGLAAALSVAAYLALDPVLAELGTVGRAGEETKLALWRPALQLVRDYPLTGIGRGAFGTVYPAYKTEPELVTFTHLENEWLQAPVELGLPVGLLLVGALALTWLAAARRRDLSWTATWGCWPAPPRWRRRTWWTSRWSCPGWRCPSWWRWGWRRAARAPWRCGRPWCAAAWWWPGCWGRWARPCGRGSRRPTRRCSSRWPGARPTTCRRRWRGCGWCGPTAAPRPCPGSPGPCCSGPPRRSRTCTRRAAWPRPGRTWWRGGSTGWPWRSARGRRCRRPPPATARWRRCWRWRRTAPTGSCSSGTSWPATGRPTRPGSTGGRWRSSWTTGRWCRWRAPRWRRATATRRSGWRGGARPRRPPTRRAGSSRPGSWCRPARRRKAWRCWSADCWRSPARRRW
ncbi:MAG: O-antigen ligase family protein [Anaeromyxobacter sp.]|nr:O-antigen ligase family protein [Anaeromyxobacter sp.]